jgi:ABC-type multidrug transport system fused ATPase/permease subunit
VVQSGSASVPQFKGEFVFDPKILITRNRTICRISIKDRGRRNLAIVGHTGAGKNSVAMLITVFTSSGGTHLVDGQEIRSFVRSITESSGVVNQVPFLF